MRLEGLRGAGLVLVLVEPDDGEALVRGGQRIAEVVADRGGELVSIEHLRAKSSHRGVDGLVVDVQLVLVVEADRQPDDVLVCGSPAKGLDQRRLVALHEGLVRDEVARQLVGGFDGVVGAEPSTAEGVLVGLGEDLFEGVVAEDCVACM